MILWVLSTLLLCLLSAIASLVFGFSLGGVFVLKEQGLSQDSANGVFMEMVKNYKENN